MIESVNSSITIGMRSSVTIGMKSSIMTGMRKEIEVVKDNGKIIQMIHQKMISNDLKDQVIILATDNSEWIKLEINQLKNSMTVLLTKSKKRDTTESTREIRETDLLKNSLIDES
tara:strand:- start:134 stop:478 length:345 start_codon:yes stop_codon:yes gene_type:complete